MAKKVHEAPQLSTAMGKPVRDKLGDVPRPAFLGGASPSSSADVGASRRMATTQSPADVYQPGSEDVLWPREVDEEAECGCVAPGKCRCPNKGGVMGSVKSEALLREFIREAMGAFAVASSDLMEEDLVDEDEDERDEDELEEFSGAGAVAGYSLPLGATNYPGRKRKYLPPGWHPVNTSED